MALNLGNLMGVYHQNVGVGQSRLDTNFVKPNAPLLHQELTFLCLFANFVNVSALAVGQYFLLPTTIVGNVPSIANLSVAGAFGFAVFRVSQITPTHIGASRFTTLENNQSAATASLNATATYGPPNNMLFYAIPAAVAGANEPRFLVAEAALEFQLRNLDPANAPAAAAPIIPPAGAAIAPHDPAQVQALQQVLQGQQNQAAANRETPAKILIWQRLLANKNIFSAGQYNLIINLCSINLPAGQPPTLGYFAWFPLIQIFRAKFFEFASYQLDRTVTISDGLLERLFLLDFQDDKCTFLNLATPSDLPITFQNIKSFMNRVGTLISIVYGPELGMAIINAIEKLVDLHDLKYVVGLTPLDCIHLVEQQLFQLDKHFLFTTVVGQNPAMLAANLASALEFTHTNPQIIRMINARATSAVNNKRKGDADVPPEPAPAAPNTRSATLAVNSQLLRDWRDDLDAANPALAGVNLPCLYSLANIAPCFKHAQCQKATYQTTHVVDAVVTAHKSKILAWLKTDPLGRF